MFIHSLKIKNNKKLAATTKFISVNKYLQKLFLFIITYLVYFNLIRKSIKKKK